MPHSEISGSMFASNSPEHIVGNHVLRRLCVPRYPPLALISLTTQIFGLSQLHSLEHSSKNVCVCLLSSRYYAVFKVLAENNPSSLTLSHVAELSQSFLDGIITTGGG